MSIPQPNPTPPEGCICASFWTVRQAHKSACPLAAPQSNPTDELERMLEEAGGTIVDVTPRSEPNELDQILATYSHAVQDLIAGHTPFDDGVEASRWRAEAKQALQAHIDKQTSKARIKDIQAWDRFFKKAVTGVSYIDVHSWALKRIKSIRKAELDLLNTNHKDSQE